MATNKPKPTPPGVLEVDTQQLAQSVDHREGTGTATLDMDDLLAAAAPAPVVDPGPQPLPIPHVVYDSWYPAGVVLPDTGRRAVHKVKVFATDTGLYIYQQTDQDVPLWHSAIDYEKTPVPRSGIMASNGIPIHTADGLVTITPMGGCGCGSAVKAWLPTWARASAGWPPKS